MKPYQIAQGNRPGINPNTWRTFQATVLVVASMVGFSASTANAATSTKQNNSNNLNLSGSWDTLPGSADVAQWTSIVTAANSPSLGADLSLLGLKIVSPGGLVTIPAGNTLTLGSSGIDLSSATQNLTINSSLALQGRQSWLAGAGRTLNVGGTFSHTGAVVDFTSFNATATLGTLINDSSGILGPWAVTGATTSLNYAKSTAGVISAYTGQTAATSADLSNMSNPAQNYSCAAAATQISPITGNTLRFTGNGGVLSNAGFSTTLNGLMNAGTNTLTTAGRGDLIIGSNRELVVNSNTQAITLSNRIVDNTAGASSMTFSGASDAVFTLSGVNTYTGGTTVNSGTLTLANQIGLGTGPLTLAAGTTFQQTDFEGNGVGGAIPNTLVLSGYGNVTLNMPFGFKDIWLNQVVSGSGGFTVQGGGRALTLTADNTFSGGFRLTNSENRIQIAHVNALGTGSFRCEQTVPGSEGKLIPLADLSTGTGVKNTFEIASNAYLNLFTDAYSLLISGSITSASGMGGIHKSGTRTLTLTGANTYTGATKVTAGTLALSSAGSLGGGALEIAPGAFVGLNFSGTRHVSSLSIGGTVQTAGTYGATGSGAANTNGAFTGTGSLTVGGAAFAVTTTSVALTNGSNPAAVDASLTFTATVVGNAPTGIVNFYDGITLISTQPLSGSTATFTTTNLANGTHSITARYVGNTTNDPSVSPAFTMQMIKPSDILNFTFAGLPATTISGTNITVTVPFSTNVTTLAPTYSLSSGASCVPANGSIQNFTSPINYVVSAAGFPDKTYVVTVIKSAAAQLKDITTFVFAGLPATTIGTNTVTVTAPFGTVVTNLSPTYTVSLLASGSPASGTPANFTGPRTYTIAAENGSVKSYNVTVTVSPASSDKNILSSNFGALGQATITGTNIALGVPPNQPLTNLAPTFTLSPFASISPASGTVRDFTTPQTYTVTAQNGSTRAYTVAVQSYAAWANSASFFILTIPEGADIAAGSVETNFPLLLRLNSGNFNFSQAQSDGRDIRFTTLAGTRLSYQIEQWDSLAGTAAVWIKIPSITGNARQEIKMYWGNSGVDPESSGAKVFNNDNDYVSVMHLNDPIIDSVGTLSPTNVGTTVANSLIGKGCNFVAKTGINCGDGLTSLPAGNSEHSTGVWYRSPTTGFDIFDWGSEYRGKKVQIRLLSPPEILIDGNFAGVKGNKRLSTSEWHYVVNTYSSGTSRIYVDGQLDNSAGAYVDIVPPSIMRLGGWYQEYTFVGDMDEARLSKVARSADWIKMEFENQRAQQRLVGTLVQSGSTFGVTPSSVTMLEGTSTTLTAKADGAQKFYWIEKRNAAEILLASDSLTLPVSAGRVTGSQNYSIQFKAIYANSVQTVDIPITVTEDLPDPVFTLAGPSTWDGRQPITLTPNISNLAILQAKNQSGLTYAWSATGVAVSKTIISPTSTALGAIALSRSQGGGVLTVTLTLNNGGTPITTSKSIKITEPATDPWVSRAPASNEVPVANQFYARDDSGMGKLYYNGNQGGSPNGVFLKIYTTDTGVDVIYSTQRQSLVNSAYAFTAPLTPGLATYKAVYGTTTGGVDTVINSVTNLVCGDAYVIQGQSNAMAIDNVVPSDTSVNPWIRTYGLDSGWGYAINKGSEMQVGVWGLIFAKRLLTDYSMPICIINGAIGGTRIDEHQPNPLNPSLFNGLSKIYANLYNRVVGAKLTHGIRAILWHQGEADQISGGPDGDYNYKFHQQYFIDLSAAWKRDFPNVSKYYVFQIWPAACGYTDPTNNLLREVQRNLSLRYSNLRLMSTVGFTPPACHFNLTGYQGFSDRISALVKQDFYGFEPNSVFTAPNLLRAYFTTTARNEIALEYDQEMSLWNPGVKNLMFLDGLPNKVASGSVTGKVMKLQLSQVSSAAKITYLKGEVGWNQADIVLGKNLVAALTFADVPIAPPAPTSLVATAGNSQVTLGWVASAGATGYNIQRSTINGGPYAVIATSTVTNFTDTTVGNGALYYYVVSATTVGESLVSNQASATPIGSASSYETWAAEVAQGLSPGVNAGPLDDPDFDGISNLLEFTLGGAPTKSSQLILPKGKIVGGNWVFDYERSDVSLAAGISQIVEYGSDLTGWTPITIPTVSSGVVTITPGSPSDRVEVTLPSGSQQQFVRLKVTR